MAIAAFAAQHYPAEYWNIVVGFDGGAALRTTRTRRYDRDTGRNPRDADVQKAADQQAEEKKCRDDHTFTVT